MTHLPFPGISTLPHFPNQVLSFSQILAQREIPPLLPLFFFKDLFMWGVGWDGGLIKRASGVPCLSLPFHLRQGLCQKLEFVNSRLGRNAVSPRVLLTLSLRARVMDPCRSARLVMWVLGTKLQSSGCIVGARELPSLLPCPSCCYFWVAQGGFLKYSGEISLLRKKIPNLMSCSFIVSWLWT